MPGTLRPRVLLSAVMICALFARGARAEDFKALLSNADKDLKAQKNDAALRGYRAAWDASKKSSAEALIGVAAAHAALGHAVEAYEAYDDVLKSFPTLSAPKRADVEKRLKELDARVTLLSVRTSEPGAQITIDGAPAGASPVTVRVAAGKHEIHVEKDGFAPADRTDDMRGGGRTVIEVALVREAKTGRLAVQEKLGRPVRVLLDGKDVGAAPWEGDVAPGTHEIGVRGEGLGASSQNVTVVAGQRALVEIAASASKGVVQIATGDGQGDVYVDGVKVGTGLFRGELPLGPHKVMVKREGFEIFEKTVEVKDKETLSETVTLRREAAVKTGPEAPEELGGLYGGWQIFGAFQGSTGSSFETGCALFGASSCAAPGPNGAGLGGFLGWTWDPVGVEIFGGAMADYAEPVATFDGVVRAGSNPVLTGPARVESWRVVRYGFVGAVRARATVQTRLFRFTLAAGPGLAAKGMTSDRSMRTTDGSNLQDRFAPGDVGYVSPALSFDLGVHLRASRGVAFSAGLLVWIETAGAGVLTKADPDRKVGSPTAGVVPLRTPEYRLAEGAQAFVGPYIGMLLGP